MEQSDADRRAKLLIAGLSAGAEAAAYMSGFHVQNGGDVEQDQSLFGPVADIVAAYDQLRVLRLVRFCPHISGPEKPRLMFWQPYAVPLMLRCTTCHDEIDNALAGTPADRICDSCGVTAPPDDGVFSVAIMRPAVILVAEGIATGPVVIHFGLCETCSDLSRPGKETDARN